MSQALTPIMIDAPIEEPITVDEARAHLEAQSYYDSDTDPIDDDMIENMIATAREACEDFLGLSLTLRTLEVSVDRFPSSRRERDIGIELPFGPAREIVSVRWGEESDDTLDPEEFFLDRYAPVHKIKPLGASWPVVSAGAQGTQIRYVAGYGNDSNVGDLPMPKVFRSAMLLMVGYLFENRGAEDGALPPGVEALLRPRRVRLGMA